MKKKSEPIRVMLVDDHALLCEGLKMILEAETDIRVVAEARSGRQAVEYTEKFGPDVVVMDIAMPYLNGFEATRQIMKTRPNTKVLILSAHHDDESINHILAMGAAGYLIKQNTAKILSNAIREVSKGNLFFSPDIAGRLERNKSRKLSRDGKLSSKPTKLSPRETEVLQLIAEGRGNKEIAAELKISIKTVEKHRQNLMDKLNKHDIAGLTRYAISAGIVENSRRGPADFMG